MGALGGEKWETALGGKCGARMLRENTMLQVRKKKDRRELMKSLSFPVCRHTCVCACVYLSLS